MCLSLYQYFVWTINFRLLICDISVSIVKRSRRILNEECRDFLPKFCRLNRKSGRSLRLAKYQNGKSIYAFVVLLLGIRYLTQVSGFLEPTTNSTSLWSYLPIRRSRFEKKSRSRSGRCHKFR